MSKHIDTVHLMVEFDQEISWPEIQRVTDQALSFFKLRFSFDRVSISLAVANNSAFKVFTLDNSIPTISSNTLMPISQSSAKKTFLRKTPSYHQDLSKRKQLSSLEHTLLDNGIYSYLRIPLLIGDSVVGSLNFASKNIDGIDKETRELVGLLSARLALALQHARLYDRLKEKELALQGRENQINALLDAVPLPLYAKDVEGKYILLNHAYLKFFGRKKEEMLGKTVSQCWPPEIAKQYEKDDRLLLTKNQRQDYSIDLVNASNEKRHTQVRKARYLDASGAVSGFIGTMWDYTETKNAQERYQKLFTYSPDPIVVHNGKNILDANLAALNFFKAKNPAKYIGLPLSAFIHPESLQKAKLRIKNLFLIDQPSALSRQKFIIATGEFREVEAMAVRVDYEGQPAIMTSFRDITEQNLIEAHQLAQRKLAHQLMHTIDLHQVSKIAAKTIRRTFKSDAFTIELYNHEEQLVLGVYSEDTFPGKQKPQEVKTYSIPFSKLDPAWFNPSFKAFCKNRTTADLKKQIKTIPFGNNRLSRSLLFVPLHWESKNIGLISVQSYTQNKYCDADLPLLQMFADQVGGALIRAQRDELLQEQQRKLTREEEKYHSIIENAGDAVFVTSLSGKIHTVNEQACHFLGFSKEELLSLNMRDLDPLFFRTLSREKLASLKTGDESHTLESTYTTKAGATFPVELRISLTEFDQRQNILCFARDITERKLANQRKQALQKLAHDLNSSVYLHEVGKMAARAIRALFDSDAFAIEYFDTSKKTIVGIYSEDTFRGSSKPRELVASNTAFSDVRADFFKLNSVAHVRNRTTKQLKALKSSRPFGSERLSRSLLFAPIVWKGKNIGVLTVQSYTNNKYSESDLPNIQIFADQIGGALVRTLKDEELTAKKNELQKSEEKYRSIIENAGDALLVTTLTGTILAFNQPATHSLGYSEEELLNTNLKNINPWFREEVSQKQLQMLAETDTSTTIETTHNRQDGSSFPVELRVGAMELQGKQCILYFARDISERKASETFREALRSLARELTVSLEPRKVGSIAASVLQKLFSHDAFILYQFNLEKNLVTNLYAEDTFPGSNQPREVDIDTTPLDIQDREDVMLIPRPLLLNREKNIQGPRLVAFGNVKRKSKSLVYVPIFWAGQQIGLFTVQSYTKNYFNNDDVAKLKIFADQIGGAMARAKSDSRLLKQTAALLEREQQLETSIQEKDIWLKEVYHRTKNNMQVIVGLLEMQGYTSKHPETQIVLKEMINRITSMSMVHDLLYRSKSLAEIRLDTYLERLVNRLIAAYQTTTGEITLKFEVKPVFINIQFAVPLGLVVNEVVSNALKYAFPDDQDGQIRVLAKPLGNSGLDLKIGDNGIGLIKKRNPEQSTSLGMRIIQDIVELQLFGEINSKTSPGLEYHITIPDLNFN